MLNRFIRELRIEFYWMKKELTRRWHLDTPIGIVGVIAVLSGLGLFLLIGQGVAKIFRAAIPWVTGTSVSTMYWSSIGFALKVSFVFLVFATSLLLLLWLKTHYRR
ncbi:MAG TPA: hypothetical protein GX523_10060 [Desulfitobacterium dehalogenans]|uniref:Uncharacterized protein n=1 Tax=Desulfitobacterium dehalogenans TaxID=36854 RepID=A0A7C6Z4Q0_9FIRM|nr:hypothetical protein [Desulfitobacterium dehalogenans]